MGYQSPTGLAINQIATIELKALSAVEQQHIVAVAKLAVAFSSGNNILKGAMKSGSETDKPEVGESMLARATRIINSTPVKTLA